MKKLFIFPLFFLFLIGIAFAAGEGTYGNETYGNYSYGISSQGTASFSNSSVAVSTNTSIIINATQGQHSPNVTLEIVSNANATGGITIVKYESKPPNTGTSVFSTFNRYISFVVDNSIENNLNYSIIKMYYTDEEVSAQNMQEDSLRINKWNGTEWITFNPPLGGVDTINNFVWANTTGFSTWGIFGNKVSSSSTSGGGGTSGSGGGGSGFDWQCTSWSECTPEGKQTRTCTQVLGSGSPSKPAETQSCAYTAPAKPQQAAATLQTTTSQQDNAQKPANNNPQAGNGITGAATAAPQSNGITGRVIQTIKSPSMIIAIIAAAFVITGLFVSKHLLYRNKPKE